jgi:hypothetical protein
MYCLSELKIGSDLPIFAVFNCAAYMGSLRPDSMDVAQYQQQSSHSRRVDDVLNPHDVPPMKFATTTLNEYYWALRFPITGPGHGQVQHPSLVLEM